MQILRFSDFADADVFCGILQNIAEYCRILQKNAEMQKCTMWGVISAGLISANSD